MVSSPEASDTASRIAASRSETVVEAKGCRLAGCSRAELDSAEPSNTERPTAPAGMAPENICRYFWRNDIRKPSIIRDLDQILIRVANID